MSQIENHHKQIPHTQHEAFDNSNKDICCNFCSSYKVKMSEKIRSLREIFLCINLNLQHHISSYKRTCSPHNHTNLPRWAILSVKWNVIPWLFLSAHKSLGAFTPTQKAMSLARFGYNLTTLEIRPAVICPCEKE